MTNKPAPRKRPGRPPKVLAEKRDFAVNTSWNKSEIAQVEKLAAAAGYTQIATYIRTAILNQGPPPTSPPPENRVKWLELARLSSNLNQLSEHLNKGNIIESQSVVAALARNIEETRQELSKVRHILIGTSGRRHDTEN